MRTLFISFVTLIFGATIGWSQSKTISVLGTAKGNLTPEYAIFEIALSDAECSARFPDIQSKQRSYADYTKEYGIPAADNVLLSESTKRIEEYDAGRDVHTVVYHLTVRKSEQFMLFLNSLENTIPGTSVRIHKVEYGDNNPTREKIIADAYADARHRAEVLAKQGGASVGAILNIKEEHFDEGGSAIEKLFMADKLYRKDEVAVAYLQLFPEFSIIVRLDFELITK